jgi:DNA-directed RNA polymerase specialized sigma24 family protein
MACPGVEADSGRSGRREREATAMSDRDALEALCRREHPRLVRSLALYTSDALLAEELAQDALLTACRRWAEVQQMASPGAWLHRVAINAAHTHFRRRRAEHRALQRRRGGAQAAYETAEVLAISREAVRSLTHRAITTLRARGHEFTAAELPYEQGEVSGAS